MVTVLRAEGLSFVIFLDDHESAHVHVFGDRQAKINLAGPGDGPALVWVDGMKRGDLRRAMKIINGRQALLRTRRREIHG